MEELGSLSQLTILIIVGAVFAFLSIKLHLPTIVGYLLGGILAALLIPDSLSGNYLSTIAQVMAALMLFMLGLQFPLRHIKSVLTIAGAGVVIQIILVLIVSLLLLPFLGFDDYQTWFIALLTSTSSIALIAKTLESKEELSSKAGSIMTGWFTTQGILIVLWILLLETFAPGVESPDLIIALIEYFILIGVAFAAGEFVLPPLLRQILSTGSRELLIVSVVALVALFAVLADSIGIPFIIAAFVVGVVLSESLESHKIITDIQPLRDLFLMIFFVSAGALLDIDFVLGNIGTVLAIITTILLVRIVSGVVIIAWFGVHIKNALKAGLGTAQIGEFAFLGAQVGLLAGWIDTNIYSTIVASFILSILVSPFLYGNTAWFYKLLEKQVRKFSPTMHRGLFLNSIEDDHRSS